MRFQGRCGSGEGRRWRTRRGTFVTKCEEETDGRVKRGVIVPIVKKEEGKEMRDYRGVTLMSVLYKVYRMVLAERLKEELEAKRVVLQNQPDFRNGDGR